MADLLQDVARRWLDAFNGRDEQGMRALTAPDATITVPPDLTMEGEPAVTGYGMAWLTAFPDATLDVHHEVAASGCVVQEFTFAGTHQATLSGPGGEIPATGKRLTGRGVQVLDIEDGLIRAVRLYYDQVQVLTQLGIMPAPAASA